jgi:hypothetical protein
MGKKFMYLFTTLLVALFASSCSKDSTFFGGEEDKKVPTEITIKWIPGDSTHVNFVDSVGSIVVRDYFYEGLAWVLTQDTLKADATSAWSPAERLLKYISTQAETTFAYNHGLNTIESDVKLVIKETRTIELSDGRKIVLKKGQEIPMYRPENLNVKGSDPKTKEITGGKFYAETAVTYQLRYNDVVLAEGIQNFVAAEGYVPQFDHNVRLGDPVHVKGWAEKLANNVLPIKCNNYQKFAQKWDDGSVRDEMDVPFVCENDFTLNFKEIKVSDYSKMTKVYAFNAAGQVTVNGVVLSVIRKGEARIIDDKVMYNNVNYKDSLEACVYDIKYINFVSKDSADLNFKHRETGEEVHTKVPCTITEVKPADVLRSFKHDSFKPEATVSGSNIAVLCDNTGTFQRTYTDGTKDEPKDVKYSVTNNFSYSMPSYISSDAKGKSYNFNGSTATVEGKNVTVTFSNRVIGDIMFDNVNYKGDKDVPKCEVAIKTVKFGETTATFTFSHDKETVTAEVPVTYNSVKGYERVGDPVHDAWNAAYGTSNGFGITCNNHVVVREVMTDGSKGSSFDLPYKSTNTWVVSGKTSFEVNSLASVLNVRHDIVNGSATIEGNTINFTHSMSAEKVSKGTFSYQPSACEAVAKYITVISATQARVDIYHDNTKVGEATIPVNITEKPHTPDFPGRIVWGGATDSYVDGANVATWEGCYMHFIVENNGAYKVYSRKVGTDGWTSTDVSSAYATSISNSKAAAFIGNTAAGYSLGSCQWQDQGSWYKIVYFDYNGGVARVISEISKTIGGESSNNCRMPLRGTWANGKITVDGKTYTITGSEN